MTVQTLSDGPVTRERHYELLNDYKGTREYAAYSLAVRGMIKFEQAASHAVEYPGLPSMLEQEWEVTREIYEEALNCMPPMGWRGDTFHICEYVFDNITTKFFKRDGKFFCTHARYGNGG